MLRLIQKTLEEARDKTFIDIGANVGHHFLFAAKFAKKVFSFEPYEKVRKSIEEKVALNGLTNVTISPFALGLVNEELPFFEPADFNTGTGSFVKDFKPTNQHNGLLLKVRNGTELFRELGIQSASLIKIDVEGFEANVLSGLRPFLESSAAVIIMEYSPESKKNFDASEDLKAFLRSRYHMTYY